MIKLFELYVLGKLKKTFGSQVDYQVRTNGNELDFLFKDGENSKIIDAKYKPCYKDYVNHQDIRQVSGYSRLMKIREKVGVSSKKMMDCVILYPDLENGTEEITKLTEIPIKEYEKVFKIGITIPVISS